MIFSHGLRHQFLEVEFVLFWEPWRRIRWARQIKQIFSQWIFKDLVNSLQKMSWPCKKSSTFITKVCSGMHSNQCSAYLYKFCLGHMHWCTSTSMAISKEPWKTPVIIKKDIHVENYVTQSWPGLVVKGYTQERY